MRNFDRRHDRKGKEGDPELYGAFSCFISSVKTSFVPYITQCIFLCRTDITGHHFAPVIHPMTMTKEEGRFFLCILKAFVGEHG